MNQEVHNSVRRLAIGCLYLLARKAIPDFPGSTRGSPSETVFVNLAYGQPLRPEDKIQFPMKIPWYLWKNVVIPILTVTDLGTPNTVGSKYDLGVEIITNLRVSLRIEKNVANIDIGNYESIIVLLIQAIGMLMEDQGYLPSGIITGQ